MKKTACLMLAFLLCLGAFCACGKNTAKRYDGEKDDSSSDANVIFGDISFDLVVESTEESSEVSSKESVWGESVDVSVNAPEEEPDISYEESEEAAESPMESEPEEEEEAPGAEDSSVSDGSSSGGSSSGGSSSGGSSGGGSSGGGTAQMPEINYPDYSTYLVAFKNNGDGTGTLTVTIPMSGIGNGKIVLKTSSKLTYVSGTARSNAGGVINDSTTAGTIIVSYASAGTYSSGTQVLNAKYKISAGASITASDITVTSWCIGDGMQMLATEEDGAPVIVIY